MPCRGGGGRVKRRGAGQGGGMPTEGVPVRVEAYHNQNSGRRARVRDLVELLEADAGELLPLGGVVGAGGVVPSCQPGLRRKRYARCLLVRVS